MGVRFEWSDAEHVVMYCYIEHPWAWQEYQATADLMAAQLSAEAHPVATMVDVSKMKALPKDGSVMQNLQRVESVLPDNVFASVIVGAPYIVVTFMNVLTKIKPRAKRINMFANTFEEAHQMLAKRYDLLYPDQQTENKFALTKD
ncbi:MAG: hypothetical protein KF716_10425 [Anaerolineae bacterium]|nr:hypothetical protein [Anaerolineae bacterium]